MADVPRHLSARRFLVTGGSGFIGTHLVEHLIRSGHEVRSLDNRKPTSAGHEPYWRSLDLVDAAATLREVMEFEPEIILNLAANADVLASADKMAVNTDGLQNLISSSLKLATPARIVHTSTQYVVGPDHVPTGPRDYAPYTEYGHTKAQSEELLWQAPQALPWTIIRPSTIWGPGHPNFGRTIWRFIRRGWYMLPTGVDPVRSFGYVGNVVHQSADLAICDPVQIDRKVFYVGDAPIRSSKWLDGFSTRLKGRPIRRVPGGALRLLAQLGEWSGKVGGPSPINLGRLYRMTRDYVVPMEPTFALVGQGPYSLEAGLDETADWLKRGAPA